MALIVSYRDLGGNLSVVTLPDGEPRRRTLDIGSTTSLFTRKLGAAVVARELALRLGEEALLDEEVIGGEEGGPGG